MFYTFMQNNSGGHIIGDRFVIIEASSADEANQIAEKENIYFDGCLEGTDCPCCGDRWSRVDEWDGNSTPKIFGTPIEKIKDDEELSYWFQEGQKPKLILKT